MLFLKLFSRLPFSVLYLISDFLFIMSYYVVGYRKKIVKKNLKKSFPKKSEKERKAITKAFYKNLCDYVVETLKLLTISKEELTRRMVYKDSHLVQEYKDKNWSVVLLASHTFNWEWLLTAGTLYLPVGVDFVYQPQNSTFFNNISLISRTRFGAHPIKRAEVARENFKRRNLLRGIAIVADQYPGYKRDKKFITTFLNQETAFFYGANQLATAMQYPVLYAEIRKVKRGYYEATLVKISEPPYGKNTDIVVAAYAKRVEQLIYENPADWLWSHNRWKKRHLKQASVQYRPSSTAS
jgi:Kdo2-lipid IVA lauroyltransferase/acyltransferase